jgi:hypothetical protein
MSSLEMTERMDDREDEKVKVKRGGEDGFGGEPRGCETGLRRAGEGACPYVSRGQRMASLEMTERMGSQAVVEASHSGSR